MAELLSYAEVQKLLKELKGEEQKLVEELIPSVVTVTTLQRVLQALLREKVSIRDLPAILEGLAEAAPHTTSVATLVEHVRGRLARQLCWQHKADDGALPIVTLSPEWEQAFAESLIGPGEDKQLAMAPSKLQDFIRAVRDVFERAAMTGENPVLLTGPQVRPYVRSIIERFRGQTVVMSQNEIHPKARLRTGLDTASTANKVRGMKRIRPALRTFGTFLRTPTLSRSIIALLALALLLLLAVNTATLVMIQRTSNYNDTVDHSQQVRLAAKDTLMLLTDAETGQRGFMLTARTEYLGVHDNAVAKLPAVIARLEALVEGDAESSARVVKVKQMARDRLALMDETVNLTRTGRIGEAVSRIRGGQGKALMDAMRVELAAIDAIEAKRLAERTRQSEWAQAVTVAVNALAGVLILVLAGISVWLVRRYVAEIEEAHFELDRVNAGLENE
ncbi:hypothetical protein LTR94_026531, partial [Friedmanniomyces endolithicus]